MTKLLDDAIAVIRKLPDAQQDRAAALLLALVREQLADGQDDVAVDDRLTPEQAAQVEATLRAMEAGTMEFVSEEEMAAVWARFGL